MIGSLPAKAVGWRQEVHKGTLETHCVFVQTPWLVCLFTGRSSGPASAAELAIMRSVTEAFEVVPAASE